MLHGDIITSDNPSTLPTILVSSPGSAPPKTWQDDIREMLLGLKEHLTIHGLHHIHNALLPSRAAFCYLPFNLKFVETLKAFDTVYTSPSPDGQLQTAGLFTPLIKDIFEALLHRVNLDITETDCPDLAHRERGKPGEPSYEIDGHIDELVEGS